MRRTSVIAVVALTAFFGAAIPGRALGSDGVRVRKDVMRLGAAERRHFVEAVLALKRTPSPFDRRLSYYDQFVKWHIQLNFCKASDPSAGNRQWGHGGPMFLPWHRQFLLLFENALRAVTGRDITVPYWDWTNPSSVRRVFSEDFMGGNGDPAAEFAVTTGPFRAGRWKLTVHNSGLAYGQMKTSSIVRNFGTYPRSKLPTKADVAAAFAARRYDVPPYNTASDPAMSFRNALEGNSPATPLNTVACVPDGRTTPTAALGQLKLHNVVHTWVGGVVPPNEEGLRMFGTMTVPLASPNDPVFFLHHANIDRLWAEWQDVHGRNTYEPRSGYALNNRDDVMGSFDADGIRATPGDVDDYRRLGYLYDRSVAVPRRTAEVRLTLPEAYSWSCVV